MTKNRRWPRAGIAAAFLVVMGLIIAPAPDADASTDDTDGDAAQLSVEPALVGDADAQAKLIVDDMDVREQAASVLMANIATRDAETAAAFVADADLGGFILMGGNVGWEEQVRGLTDAISATSEVQPLIAIDQEGGQVRRLYWDRAPTPTTIRGETAAAAEQSFQWRGAEVAQAGANLNFGIVADSTDDRSSYIWRRVLGETVSDATAKVAASVTGESDTVASTIKHFPGHGAVSEDSHFTIPVSDLSQAEWSARHAPPFSAGVAAGAQAVMLGHLLFPEVDPLPASVSPAWYEILRADLGFDGVAVTDDLGMLVQSGDPEYSDLAENAIMALAAGADLALFIAGATAESPAAITDAIVAAVDDGTLPPERLEEAATRVMSLRLALDGQGRAMSVCEGECALVEVQ